MSGRTELVLNRDQIELLKRTVCKGATDDEFQLFMAVCKRTGLDPFAKQIHAVKRWDSSQQCEVMAHQTGIDGYRLVAERQSNYVGAVKTCWYDEQGSEFQVWLDDELPPMAAKVWVRKLLPDGTYIDIEGLARYSGYVQRNRDGNPVKRWREDPSGMLAKCAEAQAIRKGWPQDLGGVYTDEEMGQASNLLEAPTFPMPEPEPDRQETAQEAPVRPQEGREQSRSQGKDEGQGGERNPLPKAVGTVDDVFEKPGQTGSRKWTLYTIRMGSLSLSTFDDKLAEVAMNIRDEGVEAVAYWAQGSKGKDLKSIFRLEDPDA